MSDLKYTVEVSGLKDVEQLEKNLDRLHNTLNAGQGSGKSLEEMRKILVGMKGQSSIIADLRDSVKSLNSAAENLGKGFESGFSQLDKTLKQGFQLTLDRLNMVSAEMREGLSSGVKGAFDAGAQAAAGGGKKVAAAIRSAGEEATSELAAWHAKDIKLNAKYATDLGVAQQQVLDKGTSTMVSSLRKRAEIISRLIQEEGVVGQEVAAKAYGTDFVNAVKAGLIGQQKLFEDHIKTVKKLGEAQVEAYAGKMNQQAVDRARAVAKEQLAANSKAIKEELAEAAQSFANSPDTLERMQKFYTLQASVAKSSTDRAREIAKAQFQANSKAIKEELAAAAQAHLSSEETLRSMRQFYTWQASVAQASTDRARAVAKAQFQANSRAIKEELAAAAQAHMSSEETLRSMRQFYTWQASVAQATTDRARAAAKAQFQANSRAIKEELAAAAAAYAKSPDTLANMRKFYTMQESAAKYVEDRARKEAREAFAARSKAFREEAAKFSESSYNVGMKQLASQYTDRDEITAMNQLRLAADAAAVSTGKLAASGGPLSKSLRALTIHGNDTHSAMRGLASGFNLLWLTWGNLAPLFAGAVISNGFMQTAKTGMEVAHTLAIIENIGGNTKNEVAALNQELIRLGKTGPFGPQEVAEAMKTLSLAGLKASEILSATQTTLNFAIAGTTSIQTAADTLVSVSTAFGMGAQGFERVGDVISKAAAESKTSVESFANAMKTASVIGAQYGVTLEDTSTMIAAMSQLGIEGTAAGTALRNMYADLSGRSAQVAKVLKAQGIEMRDLTTGGFKPMVQVVAELSDHFDGLTAIGQKNLMQALLSERGAKGLVEVLRLIKVEAKDTSKGFSNALEEMRKTIEESYGFTAVNAAKLSQTTKSLFEQVGATLKTSMYEAFTEVEPVLSTIARELKQAFNSKEFKESLTTLVVGVAEFGRSLVQVGVFVTENITLVAMLAAGYKAFAVAANLSAAAQLAQTAATRADTAANTANAASQAGKLSGIAALARFLPGVGTAITIAAGAWALYDSFQRDSNKSSLEHARNYTSDVSKALQDEATKLEELNRLRRQGLSLTEAQARLDDAGKKAEYTDPYAKVVTAAIKEELAARAELSKREREYASYSAKDNKHRVEEQKRTVEKLARQTKAAKAEELAAIVKIDADIARVVASRKEAADFDAIDFENRRKLLQVFGEKTFEPGSGSGAGGNNQVSLNRDKELQALKAHFDSELAIANDYYGKAKQLLDGHRSANLITEEEYMVQSLQLARTHEAEQLQVLENSLTAYTEASEKRKAALEGQLGGAKGKGKNMLLEQLKRETQEFEIFVTEYEKQRAKVAAESYARVSDTVLKLQSEVGKLLKTSQDFWDNAKVSSAAQKEADELANKYANMNTSILSMDSAMYEFEKAQKAVHDEVKKMNAALSKQLSIQKNLLQVELMSLKVAQAAGNLSIEEAIQRATLIAQFREGIEKLEADIENNTEQGLKLGSEKGWEAFQKMREKQVQELANSMSEAITGGLMSGDYKSIGKNIRDILQKELIRKPLTAIINGVMDGVIGGISHAIFGGGDGGGGVAGSLGGLSNAAGTLSNLNTAYSVFSQGLVGSIAAPIAKLGATFGSSAMTSFAAGMKGATLAPGLAGPTTAGASGAMGAGATFAKAIPWVAGAFAVAAAFGAFRKTKVVDTGIMGTLGVEGGIHDFTQKRKGGSLVSGPKYTLEDNGVSAFDKPMQDAFKVMRNAAIDMGKILGLTTDHLKDFTTAITLDSADSKSGTRGLSLKGLSEAEVQEKIQLALDTANNEMAQQLIGSWEEVTTPVKKLQKFKIREVEVTSWVYKPSEFAREGESAIETLTRLASSLSTVNSSLDLLGLKLYETSLAGADMASKLVDMFGGLEGFTAVTSGYYQNFYSEEERLKKAGESVNAALAAIGVQLDVFGGEAAKIQYRSLVEQAFADGNQALAAQLLQLSATFSDVANAAQSAKVSVLDFVNGLAKSSSSALQAAYSSMQSAENLLDKIRGGLSGDAKAFKEQRLWAAISTATYQDQIVMANELADLLLEKSVVEQENAKRMIDFGKSLLEYVKSLKIGQLSPLTTGEKLAEAARQYSDTLKKAQGGDEDAMRQLQQASSSYLDLARTYFASSEDYTKIFNSVTGALESLGVSSKTEAEQQIELATQNLSELKKLESIVSSAYGTAKTDFEVQKGLLQEQIDHLLSIAGGIEAVRDILAGLSPELAGQFNTGGTSGKPGGVTPSSFNTMAQQYISIMGSKTPSTDVGFVSSYMANLDAAKWNQEYYNAMALLQKQGDRDQLTALFNRLAVMNGIRVNGSHKNGLDNVPFDGYVAELHKGERVLTASENRTYDSEMASVTASLVAEVISLREEVMLLRKENREDARMQATVTVKASEVSAKTIVDGVDEASSKQVYSNNLGAKLR